MHDMHDMLLYLYYYNILHYIITYYIIILLYIVYRGMFNISHMNLQKIFFHCF